MRSSQSWFVLALLVCGGCGASPGPTTPVNGYQLVATQWDEDRGKVLQRASFDLGCSKEQLTLTVLDTWDDESGGPPAKRAKQVGVQGCGKKATYVHLVTGTWVLNATSP